MNGMYRPLYTNSWALIIGINKYKHINDLNYACNDAKGIASLLKEYYEFPAENITVLLDEEATKANIMSAFLKMANDNIQVDDRIIVFYAGHGHTIQGRRGDIGYLVPFDGTTDDISTFIRWDDLTKNSELIRAKHILYIMDACYSGLAITRSLQPGAVRFLKDMLRRNARQVLTAGKANELVADANGPIPGHSIFTGHLLEALQGKAAKNEGVITANGVMSYVYEMVSNDSYSEQTPHFGFLEGDGDFIFKAPIMDKKIEEDTETEKDYLVEIPAVLHERDVKNLEEIIEETKENLTDEKFRIRLDDLVNHELRKVITLLTEEDFPLQGESVNSETFIERLKKYEQVIERIRLISSCISHWGQKEQLHSITKILTRLSECNESKGGITVWVNLRWYPILLVMYSSGISAMANGNYDYLAKILTTKIKEDRRDTNKEIVLKTIAELTDIHDAFKLIPEHNRNFVPRSEYLYKYLQPGLDDLLFLGKSYDDLFDRFEILLGLVHADLYSDTHIWGPVGRFAWKYKRSTNVYADIIEEAEILQDNWPPIKAGLFQGSYQRFKETSAKFEEFISKLNFF
jgi:hypothetical protein